MAPRTFSWIQAPDFILEILKKDYDTTPSGYIVRYPRLDEPDPLQVDEGSIGIHYTSFDVGLRFSLSPFMKEWLCHYGIVPAQLHPNGWA